MDEKGTWNLPMFLKEKLAFNVDQPAVVYTGHLGCHYLSVSLWGIQLGTISAAVILWAALSFTRKQRGLRLRAARQIYVIREENVHIIKASKEKYLSMMHFRKYLEGRNSTPVFVVGEYKADVVMLSRIGIILTQIQQVSARERLVQIIQQISHPNVVRFYGLTEHSAFRSNCFAISQFCPLGDLRTALNNKRNELDASIKVGMLKGIAEGLAYLHSKGIVHGNLRSSIIFLEADWTTRISDWQSGEIEVLLNKFRNRERIWRQNLTAEEEQLYLPPLLWSAPEILNAVAKDELFHPTTECDVYSFSIILFEILSLDLPYEYHNVPRSMSYEQLFAMIKRNIRPLRPLDFKETEAAAGQMPKATIEVMKAAWSAKPSDRPKMSEVCAIVSAIWSEMKRLADLTIVNTRMQIEQYKRSIIKNSEETVELTKELARTETDFLTQWVYEAEREGITVEPKFYQVVYILHCSLVNYDGLCAMAHGDAVLYFTSRFCHIVDQVIPADRNIHRLHSNGDDVTIVGAIPTGAVEYASKMATLALDLLAEAWKANLLDIDWDRMEVRIGLACGPAVSGIYGNNHRGFTVAGVAHEEAVMVESAGAAYRILLTEGFYEALKIYPDYNATENFDERHSLPDKRTFWLQKQDRYKHQKTLDDIEKIYPAISSGRLPEMERAAQSRVRAKQKPPKLSVQAPAGFYIQKDPRSGYIIEHYPEREKERMIHFPTVHEHEVSEHHRPHHQHHLVASHSQSKLFGSMLGPQGFGAYKQQYAAHKRERSSIEQEEINKNFLLGQIGIRRLHLPVIIDEEETPIPTTDEAVQVGMTGAEQNVDEGVQVALMRDNGIVNEAESNIPAEVQPPSQPVQSNGYLEVKPLEHADEEKKLRRSAMEIVEAVSRVSYVPSEELDGLKREEETTPKHRRKHRKDQDKEESMVEVIRKTSLWISQLPDPEDIVKRASLEEQEGEDKRHRKKSGRDKRKRRHTRKGSGKRGSGAEPP